jgi:hypothetical protein
VRDNLSHHTIELIGGLRWGDLFLLSQAPGQTGLLHTCPNSNSQMVMNWKGRPSEDRPAVQINNSIYDTYQNTSQNLRILEAL